MSLTDFYKLWISEIWNLTKNVVPLHCQKERKARVANGDKRREAATRCSWLHMNLIP